MRCRIEPKTARHRRWMLALTMRAEGRSYSEIADATGWTRRHVVRLFADAREEWACHRAA